MAKTTVVVGDGDTVVIGGLIRDKIQEGITKIPILGDIPVLGWLFKSKTSDATKTNLVASSRRTSCATTSRCAPMLDQKAQRARRLHREEGRRARIPSAPCATT